MKYRIMVLGTAMMVGVAGIGCGGGSEDDLPPVSSGGPSGTTAAVPSGTASIQGKVTLTGAAPAMRKIQMAADAKCAASHTTPVWEEKVVVGEGGSLANVVVRVLNGPATAAPSSPASIDQHGCMYVPHVVALQVGQPLEIKSSDNFMHNVRITSTKNQGDNLAMPTAGVKTKTFTQAEDLRIACDVHGWMNAIAVVHSNSYIAVTGTDGSFEITGLPAGTYEVEVWHETLGSQKTSITVADGEAKTQDFSLAPQA